MKNLDDDFPPLTEVSKVENTPNHYTALASINVNDKIEKKNGLSYLYPGRGRLTNCCATIPKAYWFYGEPVMYGETMMVSCTVNAFNKQMTMQLPVMNHRNQAIANPDAFAVNTAMQRCLVKAIALHGLGLYIYAGEDLPLEESSAEAEQIEWAEKNAMQVRALFAKGDIRGAAEILNMLGVGGEYDADAKEAVWKRLESNIRSGIKSYESIINAKTLEALKLAWEATPKHSLKMIETWKDARKEELTIEDRKAA